MAKRGRPKKTETPAHRVNTIKPNGTTSMAVAPSPAGIVMPTPDEALAVIGVLSDLNEQAQEALAKYEDLRKRTKDAKDHYDEIAKEIGQVIHKATHEAPMPLFDAKQREEDQQRMEAALVFPGKNTVPAGQDAPETTNGRGGDPAPVPTVDVVPEPLPADSEVF